MRENQYIRVRIRIARLDPVPQRLWQLVRQDLGQQMRGYFHHTPEIGMDQENVTIYTTSVTPDVARVGLNAPAFAEAVRNMIAEYGLPQRFDVGVAILRVPQRFDHVKQQELRTSADLAPALDWLEVIAAATDRYEPTQE